MLLKQTLDINQLADQGVRRRNLDRVYYTQDLVVNFSRAHLRTQLIRGREWALESANLLSVINFSVG